MGPSPIPPQSMALLLRGAIRNEGITEFTVEKKVKLLLLESVTREEASDARLNYPNIEAQEQRCENPHGLQSVDREVTGLTKKHYAILGWTGKGPMTQEFVVSLMNTVKGQKALVALYEEILKEIKDRKTFWYANDAKRGPISLINPKTCSSKPVGPIFDLDHPNNDLARLSRPVKFTWGKDNVVYELPTLWVEDAHGIIQASLFVNGPGQCVATCLHREDKLLSSINQFLWGNGVKLYLDILACHTDELLKRVSALGGRCCPGRYHKQILVSPSQLDEAGIPYKIIIQTAGSVFVSPIGGWHQVLSVGFSVAESHNFVGPEFHLLTGSKEGRDSLYGQNGNDWRLCPGYKDFVKRGRKSNPNHHPCMNPESDAMDGIHLDKILAHIKFIKLIEKTSNGVLDVGIPDNLDQLSQYSKVTGLEHFLVDLMRDRRIIETPPLTLPVASIGVDLTDPRTYGYVDVLEDLVEGCDTELQEQS